MDCMLRKWRLSDAKDLAAALSNERILRNLRDGLPFPYTEQDAHDYIAKMLSSDENSTFAYAITVDGRVVGDVDFEHVKDVAGWMTPVPGGVGRMTITMLLENTLEAVERTLA